MDPLLAELEEADSDAAADGLTRADVDAGTPLARAHAKRLKRILAARADAADLVEYAFRHEKTGRVLKNAEFHREWHRHLDAHAFAVLVAPVEHGKSQHIPIARTLFRIGNDHEQRGAIISDVETQSVKLLGSIKSHIERNPRIAEVFPTLRRSTDPTQPWHQTAITVERRTIAKDPTIQALGVGGPIMGSRLDFAILDDILNKDNTNTPEQITKMIDWFDSTLFTRIVEDGVCWVIGTPWNPQDLLHVLADRPDWFAAWYSAVENPDDNPALWRPIWFSLARLLMRQRNMTVHNFARTMLCRVMLSTLARFQQAWIDRCLLFGRERGFVDRPPKTPGGRLFPCFTGVDLSFTDKREGALNVIFTFAVDDRGRRIVLDMQSGHWDAPEIVRRLTDVCQRYDSIAAVESNGAQRWLLQWPGTEQLKLVSHETTGYNKHHENFGVESLAIEVRNGLWVFPSGRAGTQIPEEMKALIREMIFYQPNTHTGDRLMAMWIAREQARSVLPGIVQDLDTVKR